MQRCKPAPERLRTEGLTTKANRVQATLQDNEYLDAAKVARDARGALWFDFLKAQFDPPAERVRPASLDVARAVWRLGSPLLVTTNYDRVLRWASLQERDLRHWTVSDRVNLVEIHRGRRPSGVSPNQATTASSSRSSDTAATKPPRLTPRSSRE